MDSTSSHCTPKRKKKIRYPGDIRNDENYSPRTAKKHIHFLKNALHNERLKVHSLQQKTKLANKKLNSLSTL